MSGGYELSSYLEYPFLVAQDILLLTLVLYYGKRISLTWLAGFGLYLSIVYALATGMFPGAIIITLMVSSTGASLASID